jgi:hypothetical protein
MQPSPQSAIPAAVLQDEAAVRRPHSQSLTDRVYQALTIAAMLLFVATMWVF